MATAIFLPGILMPAPLRYAKLFEALGDDAPHVTKDLAIYSGTHVPPPGYSFETELDDLDRFADEHSLERFHLYGHSGGGAIALAYTARAPERVRSLALDEAATDFSEQDSEAIGDDLKQIDAPDIMSRFVQSLVRPGVDIPPPQGEQPSWMADRPAGVRAFVRALRDAKVDVDALRRFEGPVYYSYGSLSNERWEAMADHLGTVFPNYTAERYDGLHHLNTSHIAEPARVAARLKQLWA